jgi:pimeloyl-ACP methyl ester carboxylesterase
MIVRTGVQCQVKSPRDQSSFPRLLLPRWPLVVNNGHIREVAWQIRISKPVMSTQRAFSGAGPLLCLLVLVLHALPATAQPQEPANESSGDRLKGGLQQSGAPPIDGSAEQNLNFSTSTLGGTQFWSDELVFHRWRIQLNVFSGHYRLLDGDNYRHAWGTFEQCQTKLEAIRREQELPPMKGTAVLTLHGLIRSREVMERMGEFLEQEGDMTWINVSYASTRRSIDDHAASLAKVVENLKGIDQIHFVCHSLGNLVVRRYLGEATQPKPQWKVDNRIQRFVMLGPPNNGAHMAEIFKDNKLFGMLMGPSGKQIATWSEVEKRLGTGKCEFAIIAGSLTGSFTNPLVSGDDDLIVGVEETKLVGARDFLGVPLNHGNLMDDPYVQKKTLSFLKHGYFIAEDLRHPIEKVSRRRGGP